MRLTPAMVRNLSRYEANKAEKAKPMGPVGRFSGLPASQLPGLLDP